ncbi:hypothetical protein ACROYT_G014373 [Oculina patagonica]
MGSPLGPLMANTFMCSIEEKLARENKLSKFCKRYVDDTFALVPELPTATDLLTILNEAHPAIQFTMETAVNNMLPFLLSYEEDQLPSFTDPDRPDIMENHYLSETGENLQNGGSDDDSTKSTLSVTSETGDMEVIQSSQSPNVASEGDITIQLTPKPTHLLATWELGLKRVLEEQERSVATAMPRIKLYKCSFLKKSLLCDVKRSLWTIKATRKGNKKTLEGSYSKSSGINKRSHLACVAGVKRGGKGRGEEETTADLCLKSPKDQESLGRFKQGKKSAEIPSATEERQQKHGRQDDTAPRARQCLQSQLLSESNEGGSQEQLPYNAIRSLAEFLQQTPVIQPFSHNHQRRNMGITSINSYFSCFKSNKKLEQSNAAAYIQCNSCHLKQKLKPTSKHWYAQVLGQYSDDKKITLTLFEEPIKQIVAIQNKESLLSTITEEMLTDSLLNLRTVIFTYNTTSKVVLKIAKKE